MDKKHLPTAVELTHNRLTNQFLIVWSDVGDDWQAFFGWGVDVGDIPDAAECHVERAWNWGGGEGEHVHLGTQFFEVFLVGHAKTLFLVDDHQPKVFEFDIRREQAVCADQDIHGFLSSHADDFVLGFV